jgi:hypothetical protein
MNPADPSEERVIYSERFQGVHFDFRGKSIFTRYDRSEYVKCTLLIDHSTEQLAFTACVFKECNIDKLERQSNWTADEDQRLFKLFEAGKSWVLISASLKRPAKSAQDRLAYLARQAIKAEFESRPAEPAMKAKAK